MKRCLFLLLLILLPGSGVQGLAPVTLTLEIGKILHHALQAEGLQLEVTDRGADRSLRLSIARVRLPGLARPLEGLVLDCPDASGLPPALRCPAAELRIRQSPWGKLQLRLSIDWQDADNGRIEFQGLRHPAGRLLGSLRLRSGDWHLRASGNSLRPQRVKPLREALRDLGIQRFAGRLSLSLDAHGRDAALRRLTLEGRIRELSWSDALGEQAGEGLRGRFHIAARAKGQGWSGSTRLALQAGEAYSDPVFFDFAGQPVRLTAKGDWRTGRLHLDELMLDAGKAMQGRGSGELRLQPLAIEQGELRADSADLKALNEQWLQPLLAGGPFHDLAASGRAELRLRWLGGAPASLDLTLDGVGLSLGETGSGIDDLRGAVHWRARGEAPDSRLRIAGARLGRLKFGASRLRFNSVGAFAYLREPLRVPFYRGTLSVPEATWVHTETGNEGGFGLRIEQVSLDALTSDLEWPPMSGTINARIPRARYAGGSLRVDGDIVVEVFDGRLVISDLRLDELGSAAPMLTANLRLRRLDLLALTRTFSFGDIQGRLDGEIRKLRLVGWEPDHFEARFYSSPGDDRRHRISQRAVENLTELGNGVSGALSAGFLRFFEEFSYDRIELKVRQQGDRAWIDGIPAADGGYYLVKGAGIPRIDVIGRNREVAWKDLVARLRNIRVEGLKMQ